MKRIAVVVPSTDHFRRYRDSIPVISRTAANYFETPDGSLYYFVRLSPELAGTKIDGIVIDEITHFTELNV